MADRVVINYMVDTETKKFIIRTGEMTKRSPGYVLDWLVDEYQKQHPELANSHSKPTNEDAVAEAAEK